MDFDLIVIGAGPGGYVAAIKAAQENMKVALIENRDIGGTCLNRGCIPTKSLIQSSQSYRLSKSLDSFGVNIENPSFDYKKIHENKDSIVNELKVGTEKLIEANNVEIIKGTALITGENTVKIDNNKEITSKRIMIATGGHPFIPPIEGSNFPNVITSDDVLDSKTPFYKRIVVVGGGVIGVELASIYANLGAKVTIIMTYPVLLRRLDREISRSIAVVLKSRGVDVQLNSRMAKIEKSENGLICHYNQKDEPKQVETDGVLLCIGRRANIDGLHDESINIELKDGNIAVDENFQTNIPSIYAIGDVVGGTQLAHAASAHAEIAVKHMLGKKSNINMDIIPTCVYTDPEISSVGLSIDEAKERGIKATATKFLMTQNGRSMIEKIDRSFIKLVFEDESNIIIGAQMFCGRATDLVGQVTLAIANKMTVDELEKAIMPHPTFTEGIAEAVGNLRGTSTHTAPKKR